MLIQGGNVYLTDRRFHSCDLRICNGLITEIEDLMIPGSSEDIFNAHGLYVIPGLVDIHTHGACGYDFSDGDCVGLEKIAQYEASVGVTSFCPTSMTLPKKELLLAFEAGKFVCEKQEKESTKMLQAKILGFHMEGPFISPKKKGAQNEEDIIDPDVDFFKDCMSASGNRIRLVTVAPEMPKGMELIRELRKSTVVSIGHTDADYHCAMEAFETGAIHVTHLFNAMPPMSHRAPGVLGAARDCPDVFVELIADGFHVHDAMIRAAFALFPGRVVLISDSMRATGLTDGSYDLGGLEVRVHGRQAVLPDGTLAGSVTNLYDCMCHAVHAGIALEDAVASATILPAQSIGIDAGKIVVGGSADVLVLDPQMALKRVWLGKH